MPVRFNTTKIDGILIDAIIDRAIKNFPALDRLSLTMDITACHVNGCPMRLADLLEADDFAFNHDISGINFHLNRENGKLMHHFLPKFHA